jgi:hypothetical protein
MAEETPISKEVDKLLQEPILDFCYMVAKQWWEQWRGAAKSSQKAESEIGLIYNVDLV